MDITALLKCRQFAQVEPVILAINHGESQVNEGICRRVPCNIQYSTPDDEGNSKVALG